MNEAAARPLLCLLPGSDGTGRLYRALAGFLAQTFEVQIFDYPTDRFDGYEPLARELSLRLPQDREYALIAESFAGPLAVLIAAAKPAGLRALVVAASFLRSPLPASGWYAGLVSTMPDAMTPPMAVLEHVLMGRWKNAAIRQLLGECLASVQPWVLKSRLAAAMQVDARTAFAGIDLPILNLKAGDDGLLGRRSGRDFNVPGVTTLELDAPHFLFQAVARQAAEAITGFLEQGGVFSPTCAA